MDSNPLDVGARFETLNSTESKTFFGGGGFYKGNFLKKIRGPRIRPGGRRYMYNKGRGPESLEPQAEFEVRKPESRWLQAETNRY